MPLTRKQYWDTRDYHVFLRDRHTTPFAWGSNDCCLHAADAIQSQTGVDIASDFRGKYTDKRSAFALIKKVTGGGRTVADAASYCAQKHGLAELKHPLMAQRGDLCVFKNADGDLIAGVVHLNGRHLVSVGEQGQIAVGISNIVRAWRIA